METEKRQNIKNEAGEREGLFALLMILFIILEVILVAVLLAGALGGVRTPSVPDGGSQTTGGTPDATPPEPDELPVFAGGIVPTRPQENANTISVEDLFSRYAVMVDTENGEIVASKNADARFSPASMTKVMTLIVACEQLKESDLSRKLTITEELHRAVREGNYEGTTNAGFDVGDEISIRDLLYGIGMASASDCVLPIVLDLCGTEEAFVTLMNEKAAQLGLRDTHFDNAIGYESVGNYTTAREMAMIMSYAMQSEQIADILCKEVYRFDAFYYKDGLYTPFGFTYYNTLFSHRLGAYSEIEGEEFVLSTATLDGGKTGYLDSSFLVCQATKKGSNKTYVLVLGDSEAATIKRACYQTMKDVKTLLDTYVK